MRLACRVWCVAMVCAACTPGRAADPVPPEPVASAAAPADSPKAIDFDSSEVVRLGALNSKEPRLYLELGEDILDRPDSPERVEMARQLFVRAIEYGRTTAENRRTAASAAIALASMSKREGDRRWLRAVAAILEPGSASSSLGERKSQSAGRQVAAKASSVLTLVRSGDGNEARELLQDAQVRALLLRHEGELSANGSMSVADLENEARKWPCSECSNVGMILPAKGQHGAVKICPVCAGSPGMRLKPEDFAAQLRLQRRLLSDVPEEWGSLIAAEGAPPARDTDPANVAAAMGVDPRLSVWRDGQWVVSVSAAPAKDNP